MDARFQAAEAAIVARDDVLVATIIRSDPALATDRSTRSHPTLLQCLVLATPTLEAQEGLIELLAALGAELTEPLIAATSMNNVSAAAKLLDLGAAIEGNGQWSPLEEAVYWNHPEAVALLIGRGAKITNMRVAAALEDIEYLKRCFDGSGNLTPGAGEIAWPFSKMAIPESNRRDPEHILTNALVYASAWGRAASVALLLDRGARINMTPAGFDFAGTALHYAALQGHRAMVDQLLAAGADPSIIDTKVSQRPEDWADYGGHAELSAELRAIRQGNSAAT